MDYKKNTLIFFLAIVLVLFTGTFAQEKRNLKVTSILISPYLEEAGAKGEAGGNTTDAAATNATTARNDTAGNDTAQAEPAGNDCGGQYRGFIPDMLCELEAVTDFTFDIQLVEDGRYGGPGDGGQWSGMIGEILSGKADIAAAPLTVTMERDKVVDFTHAILRFDAMALIQKRQLNQEPRIESFQDLVDNNFTFALTENSVLAKVLQESPNPVHEKVWNLINSDSANLKESNNEGVRKARFYDDYVFLMEGLAAEYVVKKEPCDLTMLKTGIYERQYAIAVPDGSPLRDEINAGLVELQFQGKMAELRNKYWGEDQCAGAAQVKVTTGFVFLLILATIYLFQC